MSSPLHGDAAIRYTIGGQSVLHRLGAPLRSPVVNPVQRVDAWDSADYTTRRVVAIGSSLQDLRATIVWDGAPESLQALLAAGRAGASLDVFPSLADPSLVFPCVLVGDSGIQYDPQFGQQRRYSAEVQLRRIDGGSWQALLEAPLFYLTGGDSARNIVFTRSGAVGPYTDEAGVLQSAAANIWRTEWLWIDNAAVAPNRPDTPSLLIEASRVNLSDNDNLTTWTLNGSPTVTPGVTDPAGGTGAYTVATNGVGVYSIYDEWAFGSGGAKGVCFVVRANVAPPGQYHELQLYDATATTYLLELQLSGWDPGEAPVVVAQTGTHLGSRYVGNGYWAIYGQSASMGGANTGRAEIGPANGSGAAGSIDVYRVGVYDYVTPSWSILDASETRNEDTWFATWPHVPQAMTVYAKIMEGGTAYLDTFAGIVHIGSTGGTNDPRFAIHGDGAGAYTVLHDNGVAEVSSANATTVSVGEIVELRGVLAADGSVYLGVSVDGGAETTSTPSAASTLQSAWADTRFYIGSRGGGNRGMSPFINVKIASGIKTLPEMRAL